ncbi:MAG: SH3 domain-containing protein [Firmicutes bacterium]|nr:SH3 domain-containing protein [Bacillota bacterium]
MQAGITSSVSPYHLAARIKQEVGPFLSHNSISGTVSGYEGLYNFYNIGATSDPNYMQVIKNGLQYAKDGKGASQTTKDRYLIPWDTKEKGTTGGAVFIGSSYINVGQNTVYLQKFDVNDARSSLLFWHQYMTNVLAPYSESKIVYTGYSNSGLLAAPMSFIIPVYNNMPAIAADSPNIAPSDFTDDSTKMYPNVSTTLNVRTGPGTSYEVITTLTKNDTLTRIKKGNQAGDLWDKVILSNGIVRVCVPELSSAGSGYKAS